MKLQEYHTSQGSSNRPSLRMANIPQLAGGRGNNANGVEDEQTIYNVLQTEGLFTADDLVNTKVVYRSIFKYIQSRRYLKYLQNFLKVLIT